MKHILFVLFSLVFVSSAKPWAADSSQFEPPSDVVFQDLGQLMSGLAAAQAGN